MPCPYENNSKYGCDKTICTCVMRIETLDRETTKDHKVKSALRFFYKNKIDVESTDVINMVTTKYWGYKYYVSLRDFSFKKEGTNNWVKKRKTLIGPNSTLTFGKYKGAKLKEVMGYDPNYVRWMQNKSSVLIRIVIKKK